MSFQKLGHSKLFGTDGIRSRSNKFPITPELLLKVGQAIGLVLKGMKTPNNKRRKVLIGKDTRLSGYMIEMALASGLNSMGVDVLLVGPLSTPGIGFLSRNMRADAAIIISASHNPYYDNGIKIFDSDGFKISKDVEDQIEKLVVEGDLQSKAAKESELGRTKRIYDASGRYIVSVKNVFPETLSLDGISLVLDCANGACYKVAPRVFEELGAKVEVINNKPDGFNINDNCGALYTDGLVSAVKSSGADLGISVDGDGDRLIMCDERGNVLDGDHIMAICAVDYKRKNKLKNNQVVITPMSSLGLINFLEDEGIGVVTAQVGDRYVVEELKKRDLVLGGEQSGHVIFLDHSTTGDGLVAALNVLAIMIEQNVKLSQLQDLVKKTPQVLVNIKVSKKKPLEGIEGFKELVSRMEKRLGKQGRVFIRYSGTEPILRVLVEGHNEDEIFEVSKEFSDFLKGSGL